MSAPLAMAARRRAHALRPSQGPPARQDVPLKIRIGELVVARPCIRALVLRCAPFAGPRPDWPVEQLAALPPDVDAAFLPSWPMTAGEVAPEVAGLSCYLPARYRRYYIDLSIGFDAWRARFSGKSRSSLKRKLRRFQEAAGGVLDMREYAAPDTILEFHDLAHALSLKTYQHRLMDAGIPGGDAFRRDLVARAARDAVRGYVLMMQGVPAAYMYCPIEQGVVAYDRVGYDPALRHLSPGTVLLHLALERLFRQHDALVFDFTEGGGGHKEFFSTSHVECADIYYVRRTLRTAALVTTQRVAEAGSRSAAAILDALGIKALAKRALRRMGHGASTSSHDGTST